MLENAFPDKTWYMCVCVRMFESINENAASSLFSRPSLNKPTLSNKPPSWEKKIIRPTL